MRPSVPTVAPPPGGRRSAGARLSLLATGVGLFCMGWLPKAQEPAPVLDRYDLSPGAGFSAPLPAGLKEVSGLATTPDGRVFAHNDETGVVFEVDPERGQVIKTFSLGTLGLRGDFEGIAVAGDRIFLLASEGRLVEFQEGEDRSSVGYRTHSLRLANVCEVEGLAFDPKARALLLPCKTPRARNLRNHLVVLSVPIDSMQPQSEARVFLPITELDARGLGDDFHPSAIEIHPGTGSLIIVAAREEALVELAPDGKILAVRELKKSQHPQPEGIAFLPDGSLLLADEGRDGPGRLTRYPLLAPPKGGTP